MAAQGFFSEQWCDEDDNPAGGVSSGRGFCISWQNGPLGPPGHPARREPNGAFVEDVIGAALDRIEFYQSGKFSCNENVKAIECLQAALKHLDSRTQRRVESETEGTHAEDEKPIGTLDTPERVIDWLTGTKETGILSRFKATRQDQATHPAYETSWILTISDDKNIYPGNWQDWVFDAASYLIYQVKGFCGMPHRNFGYSAMMNPEKNEVVGFELNFYKMGVDDPLDYQEVESEGQSDS